MGKIVTHYEGEMLFKTQMGQHTITIDVPAGMGGKDRGPTPPELFIASLGSCVGALIAQYCERSQVDDKDMTVDVTFDKLENPSRLTNIQVTVHLPHAECQNRVAALKRVAEHCPVHETMVTLEGIKFHIQDRTSELLPT